MHDRAPKTANATNMFPAQLIAVLLIVTTPAILVFDGPIIQGLVIAATAISIALVALRIRPGGADFLSSVIRPMAVVAVIPALWMVIQVLPLKTVGLANPVWESAASALGRPLAGSISIDPGMTLISLAKYLSATGIAFVAVAVAIDRHRAERILFALTAATTIIAVMVLVAHLNDFALLRNSANVLAGDAATDCAALGVNLAAAAALGAFERGKRRATDQSGSAIWFGRTFLACLVAVAVCSMAVFIGSENQTYFAVFVGVMVLAITISMRHLALGPWGFFAIVSVATVVAITAITIRLGNQTEGLTLAFASHATAPLISVTHHALTETNWTGTGAGTFAAVLPFYRDINEVSAGLIAPTNAAAIAVEMGDPFLWGILAAAIALVITLLGGALQRGRDSFYPTAGASCIVAATILAFGNAALFSTPVLIVVASIVGVAIAQSKSRSI
jgi:hypothetical protein